MAVKVVDASALAAVLFNEPEADAVALRLAGSALAALRRLDLKLHDVDVAGTLRLAETHGVTFYDASYLWLAEALEATLVSLDGRLVALGLERA